VAQHLRQQRRRTTSAHPHSHQVMHERGTQLAPPLRIARACVRACARACVRARVQACVCASTAGRRLHLWQCVRAKAPRAGMCGGQSTTVDTCRAHPRATAPPARRGRSTRVCTRRA
jgi:hypothetical protein